MNEEVKRIIVKLSCHQTMVGIAEFDDGFKQYFILELNGMPAGLAARDIRKRYSCPVTLWIGNRCVPRAVEFQHEKENK